MTELAFFFVELARDARDVFLQTYVLLVQFCHLRFKAADMGEAVVELTVDHLYVALSALYLFCSLLQFLLRLAQFVLQFGFLTLERLHLLAVLGQ